MKKGNATTNLIILFVIFSLILFFSVLFLNQTKEVGKEEQEIKTCIESINSVALLNKIFNNVFDGTEIINCDVRRVLLEENLEEEEIYERFSDELLICSQTYSSRIEYFSRLEGTPIDDESSNICYLCSFILFEDKTQRHTQLLEYLDNRVIRGKEYYSFLHENFEFENNGLIDTSENYIFLLHYTDDTDFFPGLGLDLFGNFGRSVLRITGEKSYSLIATEYKPELYERLGCTKVVG